jgi:hypothetical protein
LCFFFGGKEYVGHFFAVVAVFIIFEGCLDTNPECCCSKRACNLDNAPFDRRRQTKHWKEDLRELQKVFLSFLAKRTLADPVSKIRVRERTVDMNKITRKVFLRKTKIYEKEQQQKLLESSKVQRTMRVCFWDMT